MGNKVIELNKDNISDFLKGEEIALIIFWDSWCKACENICNFFSELAGEYNEIRFAKLSIADENSAISAGYNIRNIPTIIIFRGSEEQERIVGTISKSALKEKIDSYLI